MITDAWYTIHGNCSIDNVDVSLWEYGDEFTCDLGFYADEEDILTDWVTLKLQYQGIG